jgi:hypothetical protein
MVMKLIRLTSYVPLTIFIIVLVMIMWLTYLPFPNIIRLTDSDYPNQDVPTMVTPGGNLAVSMNAEKVWIGERELEIEEEIIRIPQDFPPGWYDLTLQLDGANITRYDSVYVTPTSSQDFTFVQLTDIHTPCYGGQDVEERRGVLDLINDIGPAFVVDTGDMTDYGLEQQYIWYKWITSGLEMPIYRIPGNMETYSDPNLERYAKHLGPGNYYFYFGETLFVAGAALHSPRSWGGFDDAQIKWLDTTLSKEADLKFLLHHIPIVSDEGRDYKYVPWGWKGDHFSQIEQGYEQIVNILTREKVMTLSGHWHGYSHESEYEGATFYNTPSVTRMSGIKEGPRFRLFRIQNGTITYDNVVEYEKLAITREYNTDNTQVTIRIRNEEGFPVPLNIHVELSPSVFPHKTDLGEIVASTASGDIWVKYSAPIGESEIQVTPTNMSKT